MKVVSLSEEAIKHFFLSYGDTKSLVIKIKDVATGDYLDLAGSTIKWNIYSWGINKIRQSITATIDGEEATFTFDTSFWSKLKEEDYDYELWRSIGVDNTKISSGQFYTTALPENSCCMSDVGTAYTIEVHGVGLTGAKGETGDAGADGIGVADGGTTGQALVKSSNADYETEWADLEPAVTAGTTDDYYKGDKTWSNFATGVRSVVLTGLSLATNAVISATDSILSALGKLQKQITDHQTAIDGKEPSITSGTTSQYWRGDKSFQTLDKSAVGLGSVENTALSTWAGTSNITTLGTISTGTWSGTTIATTKGGTGLTALGTANQVLGINSGATAYEYKTWATGTAGTDVAIVHTANTITLNIPSASGANRGLVTTGSQTLAGNKTLSGTTTSTTGTLQTARINNANLGVFSNTPANTAVALGPISNDGHTLWVAKPNAVGTALIVTDQNFNNGNNHLFVDINGAAGFGFTGGVVLANTTAQVEIQSTTKGFLPPRMTTTQRTNISSPAEGLTVYDLTLHKLYVYDGTTWQAAW